MRIRACPFLRVVYINHFQSYVRNVVYINRPQSYVEYGLHNLFHRQKIPCTEVDCKYSSDIYCSLQCRVYKVCD